MIKLSYTFFCYVPFQNHITIIILHLMIELEGIYGEASRSGKKNISFDYFYSSPVKNLLSNKCDVTLTDFGKFHPEQN